MSLFEFTRTEIPDVIVIKINPIVRDNRGVYMESYNKGLFEKNGITGEFKQDNYSISKPKVLRGLHFQKGEHSQAKLVRCLKGKVFDVAVDLRKDSPTFGKWVGVELSEDNMKMLYVPRGFAHGFVVLGDEEAHFMYKVDNNYNGDSEDGLRWNSPEVDIEWPITEDLVITEKDENLPTLEDCYKF